jgi:hypothetical protein
MTMEQPEMSMRGGKDGGVSTTNSSFNSATLTNTFPRPFAVVSALVFAVLNA